MVFAITAPWRRFVHNTVEATQSMAAGIVTLRALDDGAYARLEQAGAAVEAVFRDAAAAAGRPVAVTRAGSLMTLFFRDGPPRDGAEAMTSDRDAFARFFGAMLDEGILLPPSQFEAWFLSLAHGEAEVEMIIDAAASALRS